MSESVSADLDNGRLITVKWVDSGQAAVGWYTAAEALDQNVQTVTTVGFYIGENDRVIVVAQGQAEDGDFLNTQVILKSCLINREWL